MDFWKEHPRRNLWQHSLWGDFQISVGRKTRLLEVDGATALVVQHSLPFALNWLEVPRGPLFTNEKSLSKILEKIKGVGKKEQSVFVRLSPYQSLKIKNLELKITNYDHHPQTSLVLDLTLSDEELLAQMKPKGRYNIKVGERHGIQVRPSEDVSEFHRLLLITGGRDGFGAHPKSYYEKMLSALGDHAQLLLAEYEGRVIAGGIFVYIDEWGIYYYGASDHHYRNLMAPYLVQWAAVKEAQKRGCKHYDFLGISPERSKNHAWAGVTEFKKKFGGQVVEYPQACELVLRPSWYWLYRFYKKLR